MIKAIKEHIKTLLSFIGFKPTFVSHREKLISALGGFVSIMALIMISPYFLGPNCF